MRQNWGALRAVRRRCFGSPEQVAERALFHEAVAIWEAQPNASEAITTMVRLALYGIDRATRKAASAWMLAECNVLVVDEKQAREPFRRAALPSSEQAAA